MARFFAILLALLLAPSVSMASLAVKCGDGVVRKTCCCKKSQAARPPCEAPELRRAACCELVQLATPGLTAFDQLRAELISAPLAQADAPDLTGPGGEPSARPSAASLTDTGPPTGPPLYLRVRALRI